jgi:succinate dehydrogenase flavin-adding protein (antitoxin of CptAB toxin-antitoxin module)
MKENDLILGTFADKYLQNMNELQVKQYYALLQEVDPDLFLWLTNKQPAPSNHDNEILSMIKEHVRNNPLQYKRKPT